jgi:Anti-sigma regulatory factor (Ser/Thr protein kinase)
MSPNEKDLIWQYQATIPADVDSITPIMDQLMELAEETECFVGKEMQIETALREALANAIVHGCKNDDRHTVQLSVACDEDHEIQMVVRGPGSGFDPNAVPDPTTNQNMYETHGRGLYLINQLMDEVRYERGGTEIHMRKK